MNAKLLPEQRALRFIFKILVFIWAWPVEAMVIYADSDRFKRSRQDDVFDIAMVVLTIAGELAWIAFLLWIISRGFGN